MSKAWWIMLCLGIALLLASAAVGALLLLQKI